MRDYLRNDGRVLQIEMPRIGVSSHHFFASDRPHNHLLAALTVEEWRRIAPALERCVLEPGESLFEAGQAIERVYFLDSGLVSFMMGDDADGSESRVEVGLMGCETVVADLSILNGSAAFLYAIAQIRGTASWLPAEMFREEYRRGGVLRAGALGSMSVLMAQCAQSALCNRLHTMVERLSRWLLLTHDRVDGGDEIMIRQQLLAHMLGTRSSSVAVALGVLQQAGLILYSTESVILLDRPALRQCSCECYPVIAQEYQVYEDVMSRYNRDGRDD